MSGPTESTVADQLATARKDVESMRLAWDERGREIDRLNAEVARLTRERDEAVKAGQRMVNAAAEVNEDLERAHDKMEARALAAESALSEAREVVRNCVTQMTRATVFVQSREKMHVAGLALFLSASESARSWLARLDAQTNKEDHHG